MLWERTLAKQRGGSERGRPRAPEQTMLLWWKIGKQRAADRCDAGRPARHKDVCLLRLENRARVCRCIVKSRCWGSVRRGATSRCGEFVACSQFCPQTSESWSTCQWVETPGRHGYRRMNNTLFYTYRSSWCSYLYSFKSYINIVFHESICY